MRHLNLRFQFFTICFLLLISTVYSQKQDRFWYFGNGAGLNFGNTPPISLSDGAMNAFEGCASISDTAGNLLFYTDGSMVWARNHLPMPNGFGLFGDGKASETAIIVPAPLNLNKFYVFTVDTNGGPRGLNYSEVDMTLNGGLGDVTIKNVPLIAPVAEKLTALRHSNFVDAWVVVHGWNSNNFYSFQITTSGVNATPVISSTGLFHGTVFSNSHGYMKASPDAKKIAAAIRGLKTTELFDIDNTTGIISNPVTFTFTKDVYGLEFSPNNRYLYVATFANPSNITQYDLQAGSAASIIASGVIIGTYSGHFLGALQRGPDNKIYGSPFQSSTLPAIEQPDLAGSFSAFNANSITLALGKTANYGLPNFLKSVFITADYTYTDTCSGLPTQFTTVFTNPDSVKWNFDDVGSGVSNTSSLINPEHVFSTGGFYHVQLIVYQGLLSATVDKTIEIVQSPKPNLGNDISSCQGNSFTFFPGSFPSASLKWKDGSSGIDFTSAVSDTIWVQVDLNGCLGLDTVILTIKPLPVLEFGPPQNICSSDTLTLDATTANALYLWQDGSTNPQFKVFQTGNYGVNITVDGCTGGDTIFVTADQAPVVHLPNDTAICKGFLLFLDATNPNSSYLWQDGSTNSLFFVSDSGTYAVTVTSGSCVVSDEVKIDLQDKPLVFLGEDTVLCAGQPIELNAYNYGATYLWQDGTTESTFKPGVDGKYFATAVNQCGVSADTIQVTLLTCDCKVFIPKAFTPNNDSKNDIFNFKFNCTEFEAELKIYNRFGQLLFESKDPDSGWDGQYEGKKATEGVYVYQLKYKGYDDRRLANETKRGTFLLLR